MTVPSGINQGYRLGIALRSFSIHYPVGIDVASMKSNGMQTQRW